MHVSPTHSTRAAEAAMLRPDANPSWPREYAHIYIFIFKRDAAFICTSHHATRRAHEVADQIAFKLMVIVALIGWILIAVHQVGGAYTPLCVFVYLMRSAPGRCGAH